VSPPATQTRDSHASWTSNFLQPFLRSQKSSNNLSPCKPTPFNDLQRSIPAPSCRAHCPSLLQLDRSQSPSPLTAFGGRGIKRSLKSE
jgi:hypothetical protein